MLSEFLLSIKKRMWATPSLAILSIFVMQAKDKWKENRNEVWTAWSKKGRTFESKVVKDHRKELRAEKKGGTSCFMLSTDGNLVICGEGCCWVCPLSALKRGSRRREHTPLSSSDEMSQQEQDEGESAAGGADSRLMVPGTVPWIIRTSADGVICPQLLNPCLLWQSLGKVWVHKENVCHYYPDQNICDVHDIIPIIIKIC